MSRCETPPPLSHAFPSQEVPLQGVVQLGVSEFGGFCSEDALAFHIQSPGVEQPSTATLALSIKQRNTLMPCLLAVHFPSMNGKEHAVQRLGRKVRISACSFEPFALRGIAIASPVRNGLCQGFCVPSLLQRSRCSRRCGQLSPGGDVALEVHSGKVLKGKALSKPLLHCCLGGPTPLQYSSPCDAVHGTANNQSTPTGLNIDQSIMRQHSNYLTLLAFASLSCGGLPISASTAAVPWLCRETTLADSAVFAAAGAAAQCSLSSTQPLPSAIKKNERSKENERERKIDRKWKSAAQHSVAVLQ